MSVGAEPGEESRAEGLLLETGQGDRPRGRGRGLRKGGSSRGSGLCQGPEAAAGRRAVGTAGSRVRGVRVSDRDVAGGCDATRSSAAG